MMDCAEKMRKCEEYVEALSEERRKIQVFQRELPLCLELVTQAIETCKNQLSSATTTQSQCSDHRLVLEEFIPIKRTATSSMCSGEEKKSEWLRSAQLWNQSPIEQEEAVEVKRNGGGFEKSSSKSNASPADKMPSSAPVTSSSAETVTRNCGDKKDKDGQGERKTRRCWSPELHERFLHALQQLGGSHGATPKQIREVMKVEGLTNDEVKSHLQKYRLHTKRPNHNNSNSQFVMVGVGVGGIWEATTNSIYTTIPHWKERGSYSSTSSSSPATTASRAS